MKTAVLLLFVATGCGQGTEVVPYPEENTALPTFQGTSADDVWCRTGASYLHWDGEAWSDVAAVVYDGDWEGPTDESEMAWSVVGMDGGVLWATGPDVLWLFRPDSTSVFDGAEWHDYPDVALAGAPQSWLAVTPTRLAAAALDGWAVWRIDTETFTQVPLEDPVGDPILPRYPVAVLPWNGDVALVVERPKDRSFSQIGSKEQETIEAWPLAADGFSGGSSRLERWTDRCKVTETVHCTPGASPPSYLADGTAIAPFKDGLHFWSPR